MVDALVHPMLMPQRNDVRHIFDDVVRKHSAGMGDFWQDLGSTLEIKIAGLTEALGDAIQHILYGVGKLGETIALLVRAIIGDVSWQEVLDSLGEVFQEVGTIMVLLSPTHQSFTWLQQAPLTAHAFRELDRFSGGILTNIYNVSTLPGRVLRGDAISKQELIADVIFIIQVLLIVFTAGTWVVIGAMIGTMVGKEVCKHQTEARDACLVAFQILGAAMGAWGEALYNAGFTAAEEAAWLEGPEAYSAYLEQQAEAGVLTEAEQQAWLNGDQAYASFLEREAEQAAVSSSTSFLPHLASASEDYLTRIGIDEVTKQAAVLCQQIGVVGSNECQILSQVAANYVKSPTDQEWPEFLSQEIARIGAEQLMLQWFPESSAEHAAIKKQWELRYVDVPVDQTVVVQKSLDPKTFLLAAGAAAFLIAGAGA
jgi:hypothetical protein